jgi:hypothetical protein
MAVGERMEPPPQSPPLPKDVAKNGAGRLPGWFGALFKPGSEGKDYVNDHQFVTDLVQLKELRSFLTREAVSLSTSDPDSITFRGLNGLRYSPFGRTPTEDEWTRVETLTQTLFRLLPEPLRRKFLLGRIPLWVTVLPIFFAVTAITSLLVAITYASIDITLFKNEKGMGTSIISFYVIWLVSLGAMGAIAFIAMNALSVQDDVTFDLTNRRLMFLRITLGALFGLVLTLPVGYEAFLKFVTTIVVRTNDKPDVVQTATMLLLPFIFGFSTSLVILVLNRFVEAVQGFFGGKSSERQAAPAPASNSHSRTSH